MKRARILLGISIWLIVLPYLGFPYFWKNILFVITGLGLGYISYSIYKEVKPKENREKKVFDNFSENSDNSHFPNKPQI